MVKRSIEEEIRNENFGARSGNFEKNAVVKNQGTKQREQRILGDCWQWETNGQCVKGDNCSFRHDTNKRGKVTPSNPSPNSFMRQSERKSSRSRSPRGRSPSGRVSRWPCKDYLRGTSSGIFPLDSPNCRSATNLGPGSEKKWYSTHDSKPQGDWDKVAELMMIRFGEGRHPAFRSTSPWSRGTIKSRGGGKLSIHFCAVG